MNKFIIVLMTFACLAAIEDVSAQVRGNGIATVRKLIHSDPNLPFSPGVLVDKTLYISGQIGMTAEGEIVEGIEEQTRLTMENLGNILAEVGADHSHIVKTTILLVNIEDLYNMTAVYTSFFRDSLPASTLIQTDNIWIEGALVEIDATAIVGDLINTE